MKKKKVVSFLLAAAMVMSILPGTALTAMAAPSDDGNDAGATDQLTLKDVLPESDGSTVEETKAEMQASFSTGFNEDGSVDSSAYDYLENQASSGMSTLSVDDYPAAYDLRHVDGTVTYNEEKGQNDITGGTSYVTSVKFQNPWGTCWAFGSIAASETSILFESGLGTTAVVNNNIDLSEHHLAWFTKNHIPDETEDDVNNQESEGVWHFGEGTTECNMNETMNGGLPYYATTVFASGVGPMLESDFSYQGLQGAVLAVRDDNADTSVFPDKYIEYKNYTAWIEAGVEIHDHYELFCYSENDDWSIDESKRFYKRYTLEESAILPSVTPLVNQETGEMALNTDGINAIKSELMEGRAVDIAYSSDDSDPSDLENSTARYINDNYAHYCWDGTQPDHSVCIVGWDDNYSKDNFGQDQPVVYDKQKRPVYYVEVDGKDVDLSYNEDSEIDADLYYVDSTGTAQYYDKDDEGVYLKTEDDGSVSVPAGDGAWIVKNSWGSEDGEFPNKNSWGVDGSGYFYLSYYDTSIARMETYDFAVTDDEQEANEYNLVDQYDYMPAATTSYMATGAPTTMANIFTADQDMLIGAVSCETIVPGISVDYTVVLMDKDEEYPSLDDTVVATLDTKTYEYGGFHREELTDPVPVAKGQKYAVLVVQHIDVVAQEGADPVTQYTVCFRSDASAAGAKYLGVSEYSVGIINRDESCLIYYDQTGKLVTDDFADVVAENRAALVAQGDDPAWYSFDNLSIKAYSKEGTVTGLVDQNGTQVYYVNNVRQSTTGVTKIDGTWYNLVKGVVTAGPTVAKNSNGWWYIDKNGNVDFKYTGFAQNANGWWYVENGKVTFAKKDVIKDTDKLIDGTASWYFVSGSKVQKDVTSVEKNSKGWWYIKNGKVDFSFTGVAKNANGWWYCQNGKVNFTANTVAKNPAAGTWWKVTNGKVDFNFTGIASNSSGSWYCKGGKVQFSYTGKVTYNGKTYKIVKGKVS